MILGNISKSLLKSHNPNIGKNQNYCLVNELDYIYILANLTFFTYQFIMMILMNITTYFLNFFTIRMLYRIT